MVAIKRLLLDQFGFTLVSTAVFLSIPFILEGRYKEVKDLLKANYINTLISSWCLWFPANFVTFRYIPLKYSVLFVNCVSLIWNSYASWRAHVKIN